jgi:hypothetical protein
MNVATKYRHCVCPETVQAVHLIFTDIHNNCINNILPSALALFPLSSDIFHVCPIRATSSAHLNSVKCDIALSNGSCCDVIDCSGSPQCLPNFTAIWALSNKWSKEQRVKAKVGLDPIEWKLVSVSLWGVTWIVRTVTMLGIFDTRRVSYESV